MPASASQPERASQARQSPAPAPGDLRRELEATVRARQELGPEYDAHLIDAFLERLDRTIDARIDDRLQLRRDRRPAPQTGFTKEMVAGLIATLALSIPVTAVAGSAGGFAGTLVVWTAIAVIWLAILGYLPRPKS